MYIENKVLQSVFCSLQRKHSQEIKKLITSISLTFFITFD